MRTVHKNRGEKISSKSYADPSRYPIGMQSGLYQVALTEKGKGSCSRLFQEETSC
jgi:hypothetical protein